MPPKIFPFPGAAAKLSTEELLAEAVEVAIALGMEVHAGWLEPNDAPVVWTGGRAWAILAVTQTPLEHLSVVASLLRSHPGLVQMQLSAALWDYLSPPHRAA